MTGGNLRIDIVDDEIVANRLDNVCPKSASANAAMHYLRCTLRRAPGRALNTHISVCKESS